MSYPFKRILSYTDNMSLPNEVVMPIDSQSSAKKIETPFMFDTGKQTKENVTNDHQSSSQDGHRPPIPSSTVPDTHHHANDPRNDHSSSAGSPPISSNHPTKRPPPVMPTPPVKPTNQSMGTPVDTQTIPVEPVEPIMPIEPKKPIDLEKYPFTSEQKAAIAQRCPIEFTYQQIDQMFTGAFNSRETNSSMILDIIAIYLKGQKILYTEAKSLCEYRLNYLMLPTICITAVCSVISIALKEYPYGALIVSSLNALNFFFLNLINYLKLDAKAEAHRVAAYKFDKLQSKIEFNSGKMLFLRSSSENIPRLINETENDVRDIRETNQFILPEEIRYNYVELNNTNVFAEVKKIQSLEMEYTNDMKDVMNKEINFYLQVKDTMSNQDRMRLAVYDERKTIITHKIISIRNEYTNIDKKFNEEIDKNRGRCSNQWQLCGFMKT